VAADFDLQRFLQAQERVYAAALAELLNGRKQSHWMWFVFPQLAGLGRSSTAKYYGIASPEEARASVAHPVLGPRLLECTQAVCRHRGRSADAIFGSVDAMKFRSSMTLFEAVADDPAPLKKALELFYGGVPDQATLAHLAAW
jgi:uncharacterized protein (DUF1810 family)